MQEHNFSILSLLTLTKTLQYPTLLSDTACLPTLDSIFNFTCAYVQSCFSEPWFAMSQNVSWWSMCCQSCLVNMAYAMLITDLRADSNVWIHLPTHIMSWVLLTTKSWGIPTVLWRTEFSLILKLLFLLPWLSLLIPPSVKEFL